MIRPLHVWTRKLSELLLMALGSLWTGGVTPAHPNESRLIYELQDDHRLRTLGLTQILKASLGKIFFTTKRKVDWKALLLVQKRKEIWPRFFISPGHPVDGDCVVFLCLLVVVRASRSIVTSLDPEQRAAKKDFG